MGPMVSAVVYFTPSKVDPMPWVFYAVVLCVWVISAVVAQCMFLSQMAFFARISDPAMGGTYMTLLNTLANLGSMWPPTAAMYLVDGLSCQAEGCGFKRDGFYVV